MATMLAGPHNPELEEESHDPPNHACSYCSRTFPSKWSDDKTELVIDLFPTIGDLNKAVEVCPFYDGHLRSNGYNRRSFRYMYIRKDAYHNDSLKIVPSMAPNSSGKVQAILHEIASTPGTVSRFPKSNWFPKTSRPPNLNPQSVRAQKQMRDWFYDHCRRQDRTCPEKMSLNNPILPKRLIKVGSITEPVRLITTNHQAGPYEYALLSYCWGGDQAGKTVKNNVPIHEAAISLRKISASVRDAIWVTRTLGLKYLWVDALCIVQDDKIELTTEISKQAQIYQNGAITILAGGARSAKDGFLHKRSLQYHRCSIRIRMPWPDRVERDLIADVCRDRPFPADPVNSRAWIFQEIILSPHILYFSPEQMIFYCQDRAYFDGLGPGDNYMLTQRVRGIYSGLGNMTMDYLYLAWSQLVTEYHRLNLTVPCDKLPAISAVAEIFGPAISGTETGRESYKAGLWEQHFPTNLLWSTWKPSTRVTRPTYRAPSWSWVSIDDPVFYYFTLRYSIETLDVRQAYRMEDVVVKSASCKVELASPEAPFGQVTGGYLQIEAPLTDAYISVGFCNFNFTSAR